MAGQPYRNDVVVWQLRFSIDQLIRKNSALEQATFWIGEHNRELQAELMSCQEQLSWKVNCLKKANETIKEQKELGCSDDQDNMVDRLAEVQRITDENTKLKSDLVVETQSRESQHAEIRKLNQELLMKKDRIGKLEVENQAIRKDHMELRFKS